MNRFIRIFAVSLIAILFALGIALPCSAIPSNPPPIVSLSTPNYYTNCLANGDLLFWVDFNVNYGAVVPTETIDTTFIMRLVNNVSGADIMDSLPFAYFNNGYAEGLCTIYFTAAQVTTDFGSLSQALANIQLGNYYIQLNGNPNANWTGGIPSGKTTVEPDSSNSNSSSFINRGSATIGQTQNVISSDILIEAKQLQTAWGNNANYQLTTPAATGSGYLLTPTGQSYFTNVLPNLGVLAPNILISPSNAPINVITSPVITTPFYSTLGSDMFGTSLDLTGAAAALKIGGMWLGILLTIGIIAFVTVQGTKKANSYKPFIILTLPLIYLFTRIGWFPMLLTVGLGIVATFFVWYTLFWEKSIS